MPKIKGFRVRNNQIQLFAIVVRQCRDGSFPSELWLGVSREAISVYKRGEPWPLEVFPYEQILSFGAPLPNAYKITVEGRELLFETQMVGGEPLFNSAAVFPLTPSV